MANKNPNKTEDADGLMTQNKHSMFRQEAINASFMQQYGNVCMLPKFNQMVLSSVSVLLLILGILFISTQPFFETVNLQGWVNTTSPNIEVRSQESAGIVKKLLVSNGSVVEAGQIIAVIERSAGQALGNAGIASKRRRILQEQSNHLAILKQSSDNAIYSFQGINKRFAQSSEQLLKIEQHQYKHQAQLDIAKARWHSLKDLVTKGLVSLTQLEQSELQMLGLHQQDFELFMRAQTLQANHHDLREQQLTNKQSRQQIEHEINLLNIHTQQQLDKLINDTQITVTAPAAGIVDNLQISVGKSIVFNQVITQIAPNKPRYFVQLAIPSHQVAFLQTQQQVQIKVDGFAYQKFGSLNGVVSHISQQVIAPQDINGLTINANQALYLVDIDIDYLPPTSSLNSISLRSGMSISASVNKQEKTILNWLLAPLLDMTRPVFTSPEDVI